MNKTHNTREVEEWEKINEEKHTETWRNEYYGEVVINKHLLHHQLQKARHDWLREEIVKLEGMKHVAQDKDGLLFSETNYNQALQTIIDRYQAELDQDNNTQV